MTSNVEDMLLILVKVLLAPLVVVAASALSNRLGPQWGGFFIGLPATSMPFLLVVWMANGSTAAAHGALGCLSGQVTCALFCIAYARIAPRLTSVASTLAAIAIAATIGFATLSIGGGWPVLALVLALAVVGLATWPHRGATRPAASSRWPIVQRMVLAGVAVATASSLAPHLGAHVAGALASLPLVLMSMTPSVHRTLGWQQATGLARGVLGSVPGTAAFLCCTALLAGRLGFGWALLLGLVLIQPVNALVKRAAGLLDPVLPSVRVEAAQAGM